MHACMFLPPSQHHHSHLAIQGIQAWDPCGGAVALDGGNGGARHHAVGEVALHARTRTPPRLMKRGKTLNVGNGTHQMDIVCMCPHPAGIRYAALLTRAMRLLAGVGYLRHSLPSSITARQPALERRDSSQGPGRPRYTGVWAPKPPRCPAARAAGGQYALVMC